MQSFCHIMIRDTGVGIAEADLKRLGERFFRAGQRARPQRRRHRNRAVAGAGLVELQHGTVEFTSELGRGTAVTITAAPIGGRQARRPFTRRAAGQPVRRRGRPVGDVAPDVSGGRDAGGRRPRAGADRRRQRRYASTFGAGAVAALANGPGCRRARGHRGRPQAPPGRRRDRRDDAAAGRLRIHRGHSCRPGTGGHAGADAVRAGRCRGRSARATPAAPTTTCQNRSAHRT